MAATSRSRPCAELDIHDDHSHKASPSGVTTSALGELPLNSIHNTKPRISIESLARQLDNFHIHGSDKENKTRLAADASPSRVPATTLSTKDIACGHSHELSGAGTSAVSEDLENNPLALASQQLPSTKEQLSRHQEGQFEWLLSVPVHTAAKGRRPRSDSQGDAELRQGEKTLYFGCNLVRRRSQSGGSLENTKSADVYTLLATRIKGVDFALNMDAEIEKLQSTSPKRLHHSDAVMAEHRYGGLDVPKSPGLVVEGNEMAADGGERSRPVSRIEDSVEALDKLEEEIEALSQVTQLERVLSPTRKTHAGANTTPMKRATSVRAGPNSARAKMLERSSSVRQTASPADDGNAAAGSSARKVARPTSLLPPKPPARSSKAPTVAAFELPGDAVARRLKEQREQRRSQQISSDQAAALAAAYSPSKPHFKSSKPPTRPTFELPGDAISRKKREEREARLRAQEEEERKRREFKARPIRGSVAPNSVPRETLDSLARQKSRATEGSSDSTTTTITPVSKKRQSLAAATFSAATSRISTAATTPLTTAKTLPLRTRGRNPNPTTPSTDPTLPPVPTSRATSTVSAGSARSQATNKTDTSSTGTNSTAVSAEEAAAQKLRGKEVYQRDNYSYTADRERERKERETAARVARERAAERGRELSRVWAERQRRKEGGVVRVVSS